MTPSLTTPCDIELDDPDSLDTMLFDESDSGTEDSNPADEAKAFVEACTECERVCFETANHCITQGGALADVREIQLLRNCARVCRTSAAAWSVGSRLYSQVLRAAARLCGECATVCERLTNDRQLKTCADMCRECAQSCERMAQVPCEGKASLAGTA
jgi:hypothetical protein